MAELPAIKPNIVTPDMAGKVNAMSRDAVTKSRYWSFPGMEGFVHRNGGLEKDIDKGSISIDPVNHEKMVKQRQAKIDYIANVIPDVEVTGDKDADLLVIGWGSTLGHLTSAVETLNANGKKAAHAQFTYINPLPKNTAEVLRKYKKIVVCELNNGQFAAYLRSKVSGVEFLQYNKIQGQPFSVSELVEFLNII
jgi:2-oxoglutarate ferredoxin oxidoreductase subunit alpha